MTLTVNHSTPADGSFSASGATAWNAAHTLSGTIDVANGGTGQTTTTAAINALLPTQATNSGKYLTTDGTNTSWATVSGGGSPGGAPTQVQFNNAGAFGGSANFTWDGTNAQLGATGALRFADTDSSNYVAFKAPTIIGSNVTWTLPNTDGTVDQVLVTNGSGVLSWATPTLTPTAPTNNTLPVVSGTATVGQTLSSTTGTWSGYPAPTFAYQWIRGAATTIVGATSSSYQLQDADYNTTVKCTVTATNSAGSASATSAATATIAAGVPGSPTSVTAAAGNTQATISFTAPAITGGVAITGYTVTSSPGGFTATGSASPLTVTGLTNGTAYTFTVTATNSIGTGAAGGPSNSVTPSLAPSTVEYLVVAGGAGSAPQGAGSGAGGFLTATGFAVSSGTNYTVTVGAGGPLSSTFGTRGSNGFNSVFSSITAIGGGAGGSQNTRDGLPGGSGGGGGCSGIVGIGAAGTSGQGNKGGDGEASPNFGGGGGGGASAAGANGTTSVGGNGGNGTESSITGSPVTYAGGGGGGNTNTSAGFGGSGGSGGGGGGTSGTVQAGQGTANTGGGAGGTGDFATPGANGGSGVVVIAYPDSFSALTISGGLTYTQPTRSGYRVYRFTSGTGTISW